jgi:putative transposase
VVDYIVSHHDLNMRRACRLMKQSRSVQYYQSVKDPKRALRGRMREIAQTRVRYGYRRIHVLLKREGWQLGKNQMYRLYSEEQLQLRSKLSKRRKMVVTRQAKIKPTKPNEAWSMDFVADQLANGMKFHANHCRCLQQGSAGNRSGPALAKRACGRCIKPVGRAPGSSSISFCG